MQVDPASAGFFPAKLSKLDDHLISSYIEPKKISGFNLKVVRKGKVAHHTSTGLMDIERDKAMRDDTIFRIYSMSKPVTSIALMMLMEEGRFDLTDPVYKFIPSWREHRVWVEGEGEAMVKREETWLFKEKE